MKTNPVHHKLKRPEPAAIIERVHGRKPRWVVDEKVYAAANLRCRVLH